MAKPFVKNDERINRSGRPPGASIEVKKIRAAIMSILNNNLSAVEDDLQSLKPVERLGVIVRLMNLVLPPPPSENILEGMSDSDLDKLISFLKKEIYEKEVREN